MIRNITPSDYKACLDLYNYYIENTLVTFEEKNLLLHEFSKRIEEISSTNPWIVSEENGEILGYAYLTKYHPRSAYRYTCDLSIYVKKDCTSKGVGKELLLKIEELARNYGYKKMISIITKTNEKSIGFHEHMGFYKVGELKDVGFKKNQWLNVVFYEYDL